MDPRHYKAFLNEASNIVKVHNAVGNNSIYSMFYALQFLKSVGIKATPSQIRVFKKGELKCSTVS